MQAPDSSDLLLIRHLQENPRASYAVIARLTGASETTVRRRVEEMIASGLITPAAIPDLHRLGYAASAYIGLKANLTHLDAIVTALLWMPEVTFAVTATGRFDLIFSVAQRSLADLSDFLADRVASQQGVLNVETMVVPRLIKGLSKDWRVPVAGMPPAPFVPSRNGLRQMADLDGRPVDDHDLLLMRRLQEHPRASFATISRWLGVSETTVRRRIDALTRTGVISFGVVADLNRLGYEALAFVGLKVDMSRLYEIADQIVPMPEIAFVSNTTGRYDLLILAVQRNLDDLMGFIVERIAPIPGIQSTETLIAPKVIKVLGDWKIPTAIAGVDTVLTS